VVLPKRTEGGSRRIPVDGSDGDGEDDAGATDDQAAA
jgi:hypothetical protein